MLHTVSRGRREFSRILGLLLEEWLCSSPLQTCYEDVSPVPSLPLLFPSLEDQQCALHIPEHLCPHQFESPDEFFCSAQNYLLPLQIYGQGGSKRLAKGERTPVAVGRANHGPIEQSVQ